MLRGNGRLSRDAQLHEFILNTLQRGEAKDKAWLTPSQIWRANPDRLKGIGVDRVQVKNACYDLYQAQTLLMKNTAQAKFYALAPETDEEFPLQGNTQEQAREEVNW